MAGPVPLFDCRLGSDAQRAAAAVLESGALAGGAYVNELEAALSRRLDNRPVVVLSDMTQSLALALRLSGVGPGDEVLTMALNCMSSNTAISLAGAMPVWVDVDPETATVDLTDCRRAISSRTRAMVVYHVAGYPADIVGCRALCEEHGLVFLEDANAALGATFQSRKVATVGQFGILSFYANRQVNGVEAGALVCASEDDAARARRLRRFGVDPAGFRDSRGEIDPAADVAEIGFPASLNDVNARLALHSLETLDERLAASRANARSLAEASKATGLRPIGWADDSAPAFWTFLLRSEQRDAQLARFKDLGIAASGLHQRNDRYSGFAASRRRLPGTDTLERELFALPVGWWLNPVQITFLAQAIADGAPPD
jgi:dTDP-4-amino-4,6-dideoxygalactose transaminase